MVANEAIWGLFDPGGWHMVVAGLSARISNGSHMCSESEEALRGAVIMG
jgi:hypothetical protein